MVLTVLIVLKGMNISTSSQMPGGLQVRSTMKVVLGQGKDLVVPAGVLGQRRNPVASSAQIATDVMR